MTAHCYTEFFVWSLKHRLSFVSILYKVAGSERWITRKPPSTSTKVTALGEGGQRSAYARFKKPKRAELFLLLNCEHNVDLAWPRPLPPLPHPRLLPCRLRCHVRCHAKKSLGQNTISSNHNVHVTGQECAATRWRQLCTCVCAHVCVPVDIHVRMSVQQGGGGGGESLQQFKGCML